MGRQLRPPRPLLRHTSDLLHHAHIRLIRQLRRSDQQHHCHHCPRFQGKPRDFHGRKQHRDSGLGGHARKPRRVCRPTGYVRLDDVRVEGHVCGLLWRQPDQWRVLPGSQTPSGVSKHNRPRDPLRSEWPDGPCIRSQEL